LQPAIAMAATGSKPPTRGSQHFRRVPAFVLISNLFSLSGIAHGI
jgi:hypothetical protein